MGKWIQVLLPLLAGLSGALWVGSRFRRIERPVLLGAALGGLAGGLGSLIFMVPLDFCTFEPERKAIDLAFGVGLVLAGMAIPLWPLLAWIRKERERRLGIPSAAPQERGIFKQGWLAWLLLLPTFAILVVFLYYPGLDTLRLSTLLTFVGAPRSRFVCVDNFTALLTDATYLRSLGITFAISAAIVVLGLSGSLLIATLAYQVDCHAGLPAHPRGGNLSHLADLALRHFASSGRYHLFHYLQPLGRRSQLLAGVSRDPTFELAERSQFSPLGGDLCQRLEASGLQHFVLSGWAAKPA